MAIRVNPKLIDEIENYGAEDVSKCYHCGNCSAVCPHSADPFVFPRRSMRTLQMGLESKLRSSLEPWLCYYCGQCSEQCPREAEPGETMMSIRRWLTSRYDFTGISRLFYRSWKAEVGAVILLALLTAAGFLLFGMKTGGDLRTYDGPTAFLSSAAVHKFDWMMAGVLTGVLAINSLRMWWFTVAGRKDIHVPLVSYFKGIAVLPLHFLTQKRYAECGEKGPWFVHLVLMLSYVIMFTLIMFFLHDMQKGPVADLRFHAFGYAATIGLTAACIFMLRSRLQKKRAVHKHSHESDWIFLILLLFVTLTGAAQHALHRTGFSLAANIAYIVHLSSVVPMLMLEVPFSKWSHLAYRPLAMFFSILVADALRAKADETSEAEAHGPLPARIG